MRSCTRPRRTSAPVAIVLAIAVSLGGCGGGRSEAERGDCAGELMTEAAAAVVARAYAQGKLGTQAEVARSIGSAHAPYFTAGNRMIPFPKLSLQQQHAIAFWISHDQRVLAATERAQQRAMDRARVRAAQVC
jgi:hypothetical protein